MKYTSISLIAMLISSIIFMICRLFDYLFLGSKAVSMNVLLSLPRISNDGPGTLCCNAQ